MDYDLSTFWTILVVIGVVWDLVWRGIALWQASRKNHQAWFIALLILNTVGILPIIYLLIHRESTQVIDA